MDQLTHSVSSDTNLKSLTKDLYQDVAMQFDDLPFPYSQCCLIKACDSLTLNPNIDYSVLGRNLFNFAKII